MNGQLRDRVRASISIMAKKDRNENVARTALIPTYKYL